MFFNLKLLSAFIGLILFFKCSYADITVTDCRTVSCHNNGTCIKYQTFHHCKCPDGFAGPFCQYINACFNVTCQNGGGCYLDTSTDPPSYICDCPRGFTGTHCETPPTTTISVTRCTTTSCRNGGTCFVQNNRIICVCTPSFTGSTCATTVSLPCTTNPCLNGGTCALRGTSTTCTCRAGYTGSTCQFNDPCFARPCYNGGTCRSSVSGSTISFTCSCRRFLFSSQLFYGNLCQNITNLCDPNPCNNNQTCWLDTFYGYWCAGGYEFAGRYTDWTLRVCDGHNFCVNSGDCYVYDWYSYPQPYNCWCGDYKLGYVGSRCQYWSPCGDLPCQNGGTCLNNLDEYYCFCKTQWTGKNCEVYVNDPLLIGLKVSFCNPDPCQNNGTCVSYANGWKCVCNTPYTGIHCANINNPCYGNTWACNQNGRCVFSISENSYTCECFDGYHDTDCIAQNGCGLHNCPAGTHCVQLSSSFFNYTCVPITTTSTIHTTTLAVAKMLEIDTNSASKCANLSNFLLFLAIAYVFTFV